jgi:hypothetical protein
MFIDDSLKLALRGAGVLGGAGEHPVPVAGLRPGMVGGSGSPSA